VISEDPSVRDTLKNREGEIEGERPNIGAQKSSTESLSTSVDEWMIAATVSSKKKKKKKKKNSSVSNRSGGNDSMSVGALIPVTSDYNLEQKKKRTEGNKNRMQREMISLSTKENLLGSNIRLFYYSLDKRIAYIIFPGPPDSLYAEDWFAVRFEYGESYPHEPPLVSIVATTRSKEWTQSHPLFQSFPFLSLGCGASIWSSAMNTFQLALTMQASLSMEPSNVDWVSKGIL
jgi:hypothetical protein